MLPHVKNNRPGSFQRALLSVHHAFNRWCLIGFAAALCSLSLLSTGCSDSGKTTTSTPSGSSTDSAKSAGTGKDTAGSKAKVAGNTDASKAASSKADSKKSADTSAKKIVVSTEPDINEPQFHEALVSVAEEYLRYGMVNSIALPTTGEAVDSGDVAPKPFMSESDHESSHGKKLYFLFAKKIGHYVNPDGKPAPVEQAIVLESWTSNPSYPGARNLVNHASANRINPRTKVGNEILEIGQRQNFFIMTKLAEDTPKTDQGWVYGVVDSDTREVVASGKIASCMSCHVNGGNDRLFGSKHLSFEPIVETKTPETTSTPKSNPKSNPKADAEEADAEDKGSSKK